MLLAIIVSALNEEENIGNVLHTLDSQLDNCGNEFDKSTYGVVVVDNSSNDATPEIVRQFSGQSKMFVRLAHEAEQSVVSARKAGVREIKNNRHVFGDTRYLAFCDADVLVPRNWVDSILTEFEKSNADVLSFNGSFPHSFWMRVPDLAERYIAEVGTLFFPEETIIHFWAQKRDVRFTSRIYADFVRPPSGGFYAISLRTYDQVGGYKREFTEEGKEIDGPTWRLYHRLMWAGAKLHFIPEINMTNSPRRLLGDPMRFFGMQSYSQLGDLPQDIRNVSEDRYGFVNGLANRIDFDAMQRYIIEYYVIMPCVCDPSLIGKNKPYFKGLEERLQAEVTNWRLQNPKPKAQDIYRFCDEMTDKYYQQIFQGISLKPHKLA